MPPQNESNKLSDLVSGESTKGFNLDSSSVVQVDDKIYSTEKLAQIHPGGQLFVKAFGGRDATEAFLSYHRRNFPHAQYTDYTVGSGICAKEKDADADYIELCKIIDSVLPRHKAFAPISYYFKVAFILGVSISLEVYMHWTKQYVWYLSCCAGFFMALIGLNIQHDANHGAVSRYSIINRTLGYSQNWIGGSCISWIHQHVVQHHVATNDVVHDPDISGSELLRLNPLKPLMKYQIVQHIYVFFLLFLFGYVMIFVSLEDCIKGMKFTKMSDLVKPHRTVDVLSSILFIVRWFIIPVYQTQSLFTLLQIAPMFVVGGYYLAFFFILSHNFEGVFMFDNSNKNHNNSFLWKQVTSSSNVGGSWLGMINGGLNYQIEHHLFPRIQHSHYPLIAPIVRDFCNKKNIPYRHFPTVYENFVSCVRHLQSLGTKTDAVEYRR